ncbi:hypothetical protein HanPI659440_Chr04g0178181 [Helianthus annuus]|nr:hypothetical protein HanPI659440_Chr04g0178181 [Helianthus annuus]
MRERERFREGAAYGRAGFSSDWCHRRPTPLSAAEEAAAAVSGFGNLQLLRIQFGFGSMRLRFVAGADFGSVRVSG